MIDMSMLEFAKSELQRLEDNCSDDEEALKMQKVVTKDVMQIINTFVEQQHSGFSAGYILNILDIIWQIISLPPVEKPYLNTIPAPIPLISAPKIAINKILFTSNWIKDAISSVKYTKSG